MKVVNGVAKWVAVLAVGLSAALLTIIFMTPDDRLGPFGMRIVMLAAAGLMAGLASRILFRRMHPLLQTLLVMAACLAAALMIDRFYPSDYALRFLSRDFVFKNPTVNDISQVVLAGLAALPPIWFFRNRKKRVSDVQPAPAAVAPAPKKAAVRVSVQRMLKKLDPRKWKKPGKTRSKSSAVRKASAAATAAPVRIAAPKKKTAPVKAVRAARPKAKAAARLTLPRKRSAHHDNDVKLKGEEEHRCPYCLDLVQKHDARGVVVCPECGTWHHKDCWDVTGSCQVAHRNEL